MESMNQKQVHQIWLQVAEMVKDRVIVPTLYRALELGVGLTIDGDQFILGFSSADLPMASLLRSGQHQAIIEQCIYAVVKKKLRLKLVEGTTLADYEAYKRQIAAREATQTTISAQREQERAIQAAWDEIGEKITRGYARLHLRQLPQSRGKFMKWAFGVINEGIKSLNYTDDADEMHQRALGRVFEKFATVVDIPSSLVAYEFFKLREEGKLT